MKMPTTSWPARLSSHAVTAESTPPDRPTTMRCRWGAFMALRGRSGLRRVGVVESPAWATAFSSMPRSARSPRRRTTPFSSASSRPACSRRNAPPRSARGSVPRSRSPATPRSRSGGSGATLGGWLRFQITAVIGALLSFALVALGVRLGLHYLLAQVVATLINLVRHLRDQSALELRVAHAAPTVTPAAPRSAAEGVAGEVGGFAPARGGDRIGRRRRRRRRRGVAEEQAAVARRCGEPAPASGGGSRRSTKS